MFGKKEDEKRFKKLRDDSIGLVTIYTIVDRKTGVNYMLTLAPNGSAVTPLLDKDGKVLIDEEEIER